MFFRQVLHRDLGCASYMLGDEGEALVVDPRRDVDIYLEIARTEELRITHVFDTHDHADHVSGRQRLSAITGASAQRPRPGRLLDELALGALRVRALPAPGHRPEHVVFVVADTSRSSEPWLLLTGDSLLVGDVARPDLAYQPADGARELRETLRRLIAFGDHVEVWPAHVGGSLCGGAGLSGKTSSTLGYERRHNRLLDLSEDRFVSELTGTLPTRPPNIEHIVALNQDDSSPTPLRPLERDPAEVRRILARPVTVLDGRRPSEFDRCHLAGSINLPAATAGVGTRAGWILSPEQRLFLVAADARDAEHMVVALQAVGFGNLSGWSRPDPDGWRKARLPLAESGAWDLDRLAQALREGSVDLLDVREPDEWEQGHVPGSLSLPLHRLGEIDQLDLPEQGRPTAVACVGGARAAFAASLLRRAGRTDVVRVDGGGVPDLRRHGLELSTS